MFLCHKFILMAIAVCVLFTACSDTPPAPLRVGTNVWTGYQPLYLARDLKHWHENQIRLIEYPSASEVLRAFRNKALEAASLTLDEVLLLRQQEVPVTIILVHDFSNGADTIMAHSEINTVKQLKGKTVGLESGALGAFVISRALELNDMSLQDITVKNIDFNHHEKSFLNNEVDAVVTFDPVRARLRAKGANLIFDSTMMPGEIVDVLVVHQDYITKHPEVINRLVNGWFKALDYIGENPEDAYLKISKRLRINPQEVEASFQQIVLPDRKTNYELLAFSGSKLVDTINNMNRVLIKHKLLDKTISSKDLLTNQFIGSGN